MLRGLNCLRETTRICLLLRTVLDLPYPEIGEMLGIPEGSAMSHVHRARQQLVARLRNKNAASPDTRTA
ncbi:MAG: sigma-70 region 4 domain-containing protein [Planctomycetes bacterium]|nr:sigma-70 region 4 domain-containing protein [Planctomycetota bacterium]